MPAGKIAKDARNRASRAVLRPPKPTLLSVFHDERVTRKQLMYHGVTVVRSAVWGKIHTILEAARAANNCWSAIHFRDLDGSSVGSTRTATAAAWVRAFLTDPQFELSFYMLGINTGQVDYSSIGGLDNRTRKFTAYNTFFRAAVEDAIDWKFTTTNWAAIDGLFAEHRDLPPDDPFVSGTPRTLNARMHKVEVRAKQVTMIPGKNQDCNEATKRIANLLQLTDVLVGAFSTALDDPNNKDGCKEIGRLCVPAVQLNYAGRRDLFDLSSQRLRIRFYPAQPRTPFSTSVDKILEQLHWSRDSALDL